MSIASALLGALGTLTAYDHFDGEVSSGLVERAYTVAYMSTGSPDMRALAGARRLAESPRILCVSNNPHGARKVAGDVVALLEGWRYAGGVARCFAGPLISEPTMTTGYRWSITVEVSIKTEGGSRG